MVAYPRKLDHLKISHYSVHGYQFEDAMISSNICGSIFATGIYVMRAKKRESNINMPAVCELMSVTFADQNDIKENPFHVSQLLEKYPFLKYKGIVRLSLPNI